MNTAYELIFDSSTLNAEVIFAGTRCAQDNLLRNYRSGTLHFIRSGAAQVLAQDQAPFQVDRPSLVFFPSSRAHWVRAVDDAGFDMVCAITNFSEVFSRAVTLSFPQVIVLPLEELSAIRYTLEAFFAEAASPEPGSKQLADRLCEVVLGYLTRYLVDKGSLSPGLLAAASDKRIAAAIKAIHTRFQTALDLQTLAEGAGMSRSRFVERFRDLMGTSPHHYLLTYRMGMAQQMLSSRLPVKTVAERVGYGTTSAFVRKFKEVVGVSPGAWAK